MKNIKNIFNQPLKQAFYVFTLVGASIVIIVCILAVNHFVLSWTEPTSPPPTGFSPQKPYSLSAHDGDPDPALYVDDNGNVGIGTTNPTEKLEVNGQINASGDICGNSGSNCLSTAGDITAVNAGTGLSGGGTSGSVTLSVDTSYLQRRVSGTCSAGYSIRVINADGSVVCEEDDTVGSLSNCIWRSGTYTSSNGTETYTCICNNGEIMRGYKEENNCGGESCFTTISCYCCK